MGLRIQGHLGALGKGGFVGLSNWATFLFPGLYSGVQACDLKVGDDGPERKAATNNFVIWQFVYNLPRIGFRFPTKSCATLF